MQTRKGLTQQRIVERACCLKVCLQAPGLTFCHGQRQFEQEGGGRAPFHAAVLSFQAWGLLSACLRDRRIERPCLLALVILVEDLCGRVSACYNEGKVTPVIARRFLSTNKHTARGTVWKTVGRASFSDSARPTFLLLRFTMQTRYKRTFKPSISFVVMVLLSAWLSASKIARADLAAITSPASALLTL